jgi:hypothetical protein
MKYSRRIKIGVSLQEAYLFIREVKNLPLWTRFFKQCVNYTQSQGEMETVLGKAFTSIHEEQADSSIKLTICSKFDQRQEQALVDIEGDQQQVNVTFHLTVPSEVSEEQQKKMVTILEGELRTLKQHLESSYA